MTAGLAEVPAHPERLVFCGTPDAAVPSLRALVAAGYDVASVLTRADARRGRRAAPSPSPVKAAATELGLPVSHDPADLLTADADLGVVVAYGRIISRSVLERLPMVNVHFSLLPRWRGAAPVERAILAGDERTGVCVMGLEEGLDTGPVHAVRERAVGPRDTADVLMAALAADGAELVVETLRAGLGRGTPQRGEVTHAAKLGPDDRRLDWSGPADQLDRVVRIGGAWTTVGDLRLRVLDARPVDTGPGPGRLDGVVAGCAVGGLRLVTVQPEGRGPVSAGDWLRGARLPDDVVLG